MAFFEKNNLKIKHTFDKKTTRHYLNGAQSVYHCHHYTALYTQLALDAGETELMASVSENSFYTLLTDYFTNNKIDGLEERIEISCQYYSAIGLGTIEVSFIGDFSAQVVSTNSHIDEGWKSKWGEFDKPINYIGCGFISAMIAAIEDKPVGTFNTTEVESIVMGSSRSVFKTYKK